MTTIYFGGPIYPMDSPAAAEALAAAEGRVLAAGPLAEIGRASGRERVCLYV